MRYLREDILWFIRNDLLSDALPAVSSTGLFTEQTGIRNLLLTQNTSAFLIGSKYSQANSS